MASSSDCEEIRGTGLTTPDKPVAKRSSTVPVQGRVAKKRTNEHGACLASPPIDAIAHAALCPSHPLVSRCPFTTLPSFMSLSCTLARAPIRVTMVRNCLPVDYREKNRTLTDTHLISTTVNVIFENLIHFSSRRIIFGKLDGISRAKEKNLNESFSLVFLMSSRFRVNTILESYSR